ncbi:MAG: DUF1549 and DUF1553 domain-containing protein, partial [Acidobacteria bacterium]|nr:DUF1549 and DUF1553 domain-containing protein [Acidobacteriota bacterium]
LYRSAAHLGEPKMPPGSRRPLPQGDLAILKEWIEAGAPYPEAGAATREPSWWSMKKPRRLPVPELDENPANPIDAFIQAKLREKGLEPAPAADRVTLLRRAYFDLVGLPPTPAQADRFLQNTSPDAFEELVDELLASSHYGERWGRHWLDVVRYADSAGFEGDVFYPNAWRYRDYVIKSFNEDKPYDRFVQEQIAGDELFPNNLEMEGFYDISPEKLEHMEARVGTTLYTFGPEIQESHLDAERLRYERLTDAVDMTAAAFMGLTLECSRCHDHKFDPFTQKDYFRLQAVFAASSRKTIPVVSSMSTGHRREDYHRMIALAEARASYQRFEKQVKDRVIEIKKKEYPPEVVRAYEVPMKERTARELELAAPLAQFYTEMNIEDHLTDGEKTRHRNTMQRLARAVLDVPLEDASHKVKYDGFFDVPSATVLGHLQPELVPDTYLLNRGELSLKREIVEPGLPAALRDDSVPDRLSMGPHGPRYRKHFALWLTRPTHPLTARVMVNRIWQGHFGQGLVRTSNDFGRQGDRPSHPELLDWLATEFVDRGWSVKSMHRLIMLSDAYRRDSRFTAAAHRQQDPDNRLLWRMNRRRLEGEAVWDSLHAVAGNLNPTMGGRPAIPPLSKVEMSSLRIKPWWAVSEDPAAGRRRGVYILARRNFTFPMFDKFDVPNSSVSCAGREVTTVAPQALWSLNNDASFRQARVLADRLIREAGASPADQVDLAWRLVLARLPSAEERQEAMTLLSRLTSSNGSQAPHPAGEGDETKTRHSDALTQLCLTMFNLSEFFYID